MNQSRLWRAFLWGALSIPFAANAGTLILTQAGLNANDSVLWNQLGVVGTLVGSPSSNNMFTAISGNSVTVTATTQGGGDKTADPSVWSLPTPDTAIDNQFTGPTSFAFSTPVMAAGFYISDAFGATMTNAVITEFFQGGQVSLFDNLNTPQQVIFIGISDPVSDITGISISTTSGGGNNYYAFGTLFLKDTPPPPQNCVPGVNCTSGTPEPATLLLAAPAFVAILWWERKRRIRGKHN